MFNFVKEKIKSVYSSFTQKLAGIFSGGTPDEQFLQQLSTLLLQADAGVTLTKTVVDQLRARLAQEFGAQATMQDAKRILEEILALQLAGVGTPEPYPTVVLVLGVNGTGKTTFVAKYAHLLKQKGYRPLCVAADTFRAAAQEQLSQWSARIDVPVFTGKPDQDPAAVVFDACMQFKNGAGLYTHLIIDTAGRLQTKVNLMHELEKMCRVLQRQLPEHTSAIWLTVDSMLGQNSISQARLFHESTKVNGLILTKVDGTGRGGALFAIVQELGIPIVYMTYGEKLEEIKTFDAKRFVQDLMSE